MTAATSLFSQPAPVTLASVHEKLSKAMSTLSSNPTLHAQAAKLFKEHPEAKNEVGAATILLTKVEALLPENKTTLPPTNLTFTPVATPAAASTAPATPAPAPTNPTPMIPVVAAEPVPGLTNMPEPIASAPTNQTEGEEDDGDFINDEETEAENDNEARTDTAASPTPVATKAQEVIWPEDSLGTGLLSELARTIARGESVKLVLSHVADGLLVTVYPNPIPGETETSLPMQFKGAPKEIEDQLPELMRDYQEGRNIAREAVSYAAQVKAAAEAAKKKAQPATAQKGKQEGQLTIEVTPKNSAITLSQGDKTFPVSSGKAVTLSNGDYQLTVQADGYETAQETITVGGGNVRKRINLTKQTAAPLF